MNRVLLLSGTPGVGKTTIGRWLSKQGYPVYNILDIAKEMDYIDDIDDDRDAVVIDDDKVHDNLKTWIGQHSDDIIVVEGHIADIVPSDLLFHCIILSPSIDTLRPRLVDRGYTSSKIMENIEAHIMKECLYDALEYYGKNKVTEIATEDKLEIQKQINSVLTRSLKSK